MLALLVISSDNSLVTNSGPIPDGSPNNIAILILFLLILFLNFVTDYAYIFNYKLTKEGKNEKKF